MKLEEDINNFDQPKEIVLGDQSSLLNDISIRSNVISKKLTILTRLVLLLKIESSCLIKRTVT